MEISWSVDLVMMSSRPRRYSWGRNKGWHFQQQSNKRGPSIGPGRIYLTEEGVSKSSERPFPLLCIKLIKCCNLKRAGRKTSYSACARSGLVSLALTLDLAILYSCTHRHTERAWSSR